MAISTTTVATSGRYGTVTNRQTVLNTNGRYDKYVSDIPIEIAMKKPDLQFVMTKSSMEFNMKKPNIEMVMR